MRISHGGVRKQHATAALLLHPPRQGGRSQTVQDSFRTAAREYRFIGQAL